MYKSCKDLRITVRLRIMVNFRNSALSSIWGVRNLSLKLCRISKSFPLYLFFTPNRDLSHRLKSCSAKLSDKVGTAYTLPRKDFYDEYNEKVEQD